ncbi:MAG: hypothetical protein ACK4YP_20310, partial [Myxococcota bacterium]
MLALLLACAAPPKGDGVPADDGAPADTGAAAWVTLPPGCEAPGALPADPLALVGQARTTQENVGYLVELVDVERLGDLVVGVGQGGFLVYDVSDPATPALVGRANGPGQDRFHRVENLDGRYVAASNREHGLAILDVADPTAPRLAWSRREADLEGLSAVGDTLFVTTDDGVLALDVADPVAPVEIGAADGLGAPWELSDAVGDFVYAADN